MNSKKIWVIVMLLLVVFMIAGPVQTSYAAANGSGVLAAAAVADKADGTGGSDVISKLFSLLFDRILGPILNIFGGNKAATALPENPVKVIPLPPGDTIADNGVLRGKVIVVDPGHGGSNPGAIANNTRETDNNLAVSLKLRDKLVKAGAKVIMTRESDRTVAAEGSSLGQELAARVDIAETNHADLFISIHSNSNPDPSIYGAMTFYPSGKASKLALEVQNSIIKETGAADKGTSTATFYVLRNTTMPSILVEMGFVTNAGEAGNLQDDGYRNKLAQGIVNGVVKYLNN